MSKQDVETIISDAYKILATNPTDMEAMTNVALSEYKRCIGICGDNTPEYAKYLGYLDGKELYPDVGVVGLKKFITDMLEGQVRTIYSGP